MDEVLKLRQERAGIIAKARELVEKAEKENRNLSGEEQQSYDKMWTDIEALGQRADRLERQAAAEADLKLPAGGASRPEPDNGNGGAPEGRGRGSAEYRRAFEAYMRHGVREERALQVDVDTAGGYLVPDEFASGLIQALDANVYMRQWGTVVQIPNADSLGVPTLDADPGDATWTAELATGDEDTAMKFGDRQLRPHPLAKRIKVSRTLLRKAPNVEGLVRDRLGYKFGVTMEKAFLVGSGVGQPLGVFTASANGITTARDMATGNEATAMAYAGLVNAKVHLRQGYWGRARWLFHGDALKQLMVLKDAADHYIWQENARVGEPSTLLGLPVFFSEFAPNTFTSGLYVGLLGDFSNYWIADALDMELQRLDELYSETNQVGFIGRMESDGMPVLAEAFVRVKLGSE